jgi:hypothetical protein
MNVNVFCRLTSSRLVCTGNSVVVTDAGCGFSHMVALLAKYTVVRLRKDGVVIKERSVRNTTETCNVVCAARVAREVMLNAAGLIMIAPDKRVGLRSPQFRLSIKVATDAAAAFSGVDVVACSTPCSTTVLTNGIHIMYYDHVAHVVCRSKTRVVSTRGGAWQPMVDGTTLLVNCSSPDAVVADLCHTVFAIGTYQIRKNY